MRCGTNLWCRFLRARKFDVPKAKAMLLSAEQWRKDEKVEELARCVIYFSFFSIFLLHNDEHFFLLLFVSFCRASAVVC